MRILVTGGAGYIGSITTRFLLDAGHQCVVLDNLVNGHHQAVDPRADFVEGSVADRGVVADALSGCDAVMHLAGLIEVAESQRDPQRYWAANTRDPLVMLEAMVDAGVSEIVFSSTAAVYGEPLELPITEEAPTIPVNVYGETKLAFERHLDAFAEQGIRSVRFRYFNVAGAWPDGSLGEAHTPETHIIPRVLRAMQAGEREFEVFGDDYPTRDGTCVRDYIHVMDLALAHLLGLEWLHAGNGGGVFNLGNGNGFTNMEVVQACAETTGTRVDVHAGPRRTGDPAQLIASGARAAATLGWRPERPALSTIVADAWAWHRAMPDGYR